MREYLPVKLVKFCFTALHSSILEKFRELVGDIEYAFEFYHFLFLMHRFEINVRLYYFSKVLKLLYCSEMTGC